VPKDDPRGSILTQIVGIPGSRARCRGAGIATGAGGSSPADTASEPIEPPRPHALGGMVGRAMMSPASRVDSVLVVAAKPAHGRPVAAARRLLPVLLPAPCSEIEPVVSTELKVAATRIAGVGVKDAVALA